MPAHSRSKNGVASLAYVAGIHVLIHIGEKKTWMAGTSPAMTKSVIQRPGMTTRMNHPAAIVAR
jgi:hypothetical protein